MGLWGWRGAVFVLFNHEERVTQSHGVPGPNQPGSPFQEYTIQLRNKINNSEKLAQDSKVTCGHSPYVFRRPEVQEESTLNGISEESFSLHGSSKERLDPLHTPGPTLPLTHLRNGQTEHFGGSGTLSNPSIKLV